MAQAGFPEEERANLERRFVILLQKNDLASFLDKKFNQKGISVDYPLFPGGATMLMYAAGESTPENVQVLLDHGAQIATADNKGRNALHFSCKAGNVETTALLLGILVESEDDETKDAQTNGGVTPMMLAVESMNYMLITECLNASMNPFLKDAIGREAKDYAGETLGVDRD